MELRWRDAARRRALGIPRPPVSVRTYLAPVAVLARVLAGHRWMLGGGLAIPISLGQFYRHHRDVDIVVPMEALPAVAGAMSAAGWRLVRRFSCTARSRGIDILVPVSKTGVIMGLRPRRLKFVSRDRRTGPDAFLAEIDVFPFQEHARYVETCDRHRIAKMAPLVGRRVRVDGVDITCLHLYYVAWLKAHRVGRINRLDRAVMEQGAEAARAWLEG